MVANAKSKANLLGDDTKETENREGQQNSINKSQQNLSNGTKEIDALDVHHRELQASSLTPTHTFDSV